MGVFIARGETFRNWTAIAVDAAGDVYATATGVDIYKSTGGGVFTALGEGARTYRGLAVAPNGDVYASVSGGDIYKQTAPVPPTLATAAIATWTAPAATAQTRYTVPASAALSTWVAPSASAQIKRRRAISVPCSVASYSVPTSSTSYSIEVS